MTVGRSIPALVLLSASALAQSEPAFEPPEIVALTSARGGFQGRFAEVGLTDDLLGLMRKYTWRPGCPVPIADLAALRLSYWDFSGIPRDGQLIVNRAVAEDVKFFFRELFTHGFLIEKLAPVENYKGDDNASMAANNTSGFNCRDVTGEPGKFSNHSWGRAIDINPLTNPMLLHGEALPPAGARYSDRTKASAGSVLGGSFIVKLFQSRGWTWGGMWTSPDYQHFEKPDVSRGQKKDVHPI